MQNKIQIEVLVESSKNCSRSRIVASPYYGMKILVAAASDRANTVCGSYYIWWWHLRREGGREKQTVMFKPLVLIILLPLSY